jgi:hypothetical protein
VFRVFLPVVNAQGDTPAEVADPAHTPVSGQADGGG